MFSVFVVNLLLVPSLILAFQFFRCSVVTEGGDDCRTSLGSLVCDHYLSRAILLAYTYLAKKHGTCYFIFEWRPFSGIIYHLAIVAHSRTDHIVPPKGG